ncbi:hypothetical protein BX616_001071 [Lobosporangium transversale]|uniref:Uncharacterized protein n=1 Tax=Lobosporangium transversale TaxID=64571 RepID=A0A1Y2GNN2_9FUNG|nr:hypothetical protein BCR41DRAFT_396410 [Lobosporangium transversale]KAF9905198.1 hypothetical protein BX616_001071 [Lobosporangium transversale]ORZ15464.1 hypothetical protein BCR41DRAFT_396410 [Lobosporangium transversale]|eukprot:XP_021881212.1 hypothetical protein BCR41DRAFT_396410 [Lobosporangium transversale]
MTESGYLQHLVDDKITMAEGDELISISSNLIEERQRMLQQHRAEFITDEGYETYLSERKSITPAILEKPMEIEKSSWNPSTSTIKRGRASLKNQHGKKSTPSKNKRNKPSDSQWSNTTHIKQIQTQAERLRNLPPLHKHEITNQTLARLLTIWIKNQDDYNPEDDEDQRNNNNNEY